MSNASFFEVQTQRVEQDALIGDLLDRYVCLAEAVERYLANVERVAAIPRRPSAASPRPPGKAAGAPVPPGDERRGAHRAAARPGRRGRRPGPTRPRPREEPAMMPAPTNKARLRQVCPRCGREPLSAWLPRGATGLVVPDGRAEPGMPDSNFAPPQFGRDTLWSPVPLAEWSRANCGDRRLHARRRGCCCPGETSSRRSSSRSSLPAW
jgi:hypothetical protein